jgi:drug/metabolite transporter (DMT)-like permease
MNNYVDPPPKAGDLQRSRMWPTVFVFLASIIWGTTFVTQKLAGYHMGSFTYNGVRFALGVLSLIPVILIFEKSSPEKNRHTLKAGLFGGAILFIASNLQQFGIILNKEPGSASEAGFITGLYLVFTPILGLTLGRKAHPLTWIACVVAFGGLALISIGPEGLSSIKVSDGLLLLGAVFWAAHILLIDRFAHSVNPIRFTAVQFAVSSALSMISAFVFETVSISGIMDGIFPILFGGIFACGTAYTFQILGQRGVEPSKAAIIFSLEALFASVSEAVWLGELMTARKYLGGAIIFTGILLSQITPKKRWLKRKSE